MDIAPAFLSPSVDEGSYRASSRAREGLGRLRSLLADMGSVAVAFSGGVDSTLLLAVAHEVLGPRMVAVSAVSPAFPAREMREAREFCEARGIRQVRVEPHEMDVEGYRDNPPDRCYICKKAIFGALGRIAAEMGFETVCDGTNVDDEGDYRPGMRALSEMGVRSPLREAGLSKADIRELLRQMGIPTWQKPSIACLSSRFVYGERITEQKLGMVDAAEEFLQDLGFSQVRVRVHGDMARIEVLPDDVVRLAARPLCAQVDSRLRELGFSHVALDLRGYRTGSMNVGLGN